MSLFSHLPPLLPPPRLDKTSKWSGSRQVGPEDHSSHPVNMFPIESWCFFFYSKIFVIPIYCWLSWVLFYFIFWLLSCQICPMKFLFSLYLLELSNINYRPVSNFVYIKGQEIWLNLYLFYLYLLFVSCLQLWNKFNTWY